MEGRPFSGPHGGRQPALEQNLVKHRAYQMLLALFYTEELKRQILRLNDKSRAKTLQDLVDKQLITPTEKSEILRLIDDRNIIAHEMQSFFLDLSPRAFKYGVADYMRRHRHDAVESLPRYLKRLNSIPPVSGIYKLQERDLARFHFEFAERTLLAEIVRLERKINKLAKARSTAIRAINQEIGSLSGDGFVGEMHPGHPLNRYDNGRLTQRGAEICYRLFDAGKSPLAVAHLLRISLVAARKRKRSWRGAGGKSRCKVDVSTLPERRFYRSDDD